jgi:hypothetical protein
MLEESSRTRRPSGLTLDVGVRTQRFYRQLIVEATHFSTHTSLT